MSDWDEGILLALAVGEERVVTHVLAADAAGLEVNTSLSVRVGEEVDIQLRGGGARRLRANVRVRVESRFPADPGHRVRFAFLAPDSPDLAAVLALAQRRGIAPQETPKGSAASVAPDDAVQVRSAEPTELFAVDLDVPGAAKVLDELLSGAATLACEPPPPVNATVLLRLGHPDHRPTLLPGRVVYHGRVRDGRPGIGVALDPLPEILRRDLKHLREALARNP